MSDESRSETSVLSEFDRQAAEAVGIGEADWYVDSHEAAPVWPEPMRDALLALDERIVSLGGQKSQD